MTFAEENKLLESVSYHVQYLQAFFRRVWLYVPKWRSQIQSVFVMQRHANGVGVRLCTAE